MSYEGTFKNLLCEAYTNNVDSMSLHTADPGTTGANDSEVAHADLTWGSATNGISSATAAFDGVSGHFTHVGLWDGETFRQGVECEINYSVAVDLAILVTHKAGE